MKWEVYHKLHVSNVKIKRYGKDIALKERGRDQSKNKK